MASDNEREWREALKIGDEVIISGYSGGLCAVTKTSPKMVTCGTRRFWRGTGELVGWTVSYTTINKPTEASTFHGLVEQAVIRLKMLQPGPGRIDRLRRIIAILEAPDGK